MLLRAGLLSTKETVRVMLNTCQFSPFYRDLADFSSQIATCFTSLISLHVSRTSSIETSTTTTQTRHAVINQSVKYVLFSLDN